MPNLFRILVISVFTLSFSNTVLALAPPSGDETEPKENGKREKSDKTPSQKPAKKRRADTSSVPNPAIPLPQAPAVQAASLSGSSSFIPAAALSHVQSSFISEKQEKRQPKQTINLEGDNDVTEIKKETGLYHPLVEEIGNELRIKFLNAQSCIQCQELMQKKIVEIVKSKREKSKELFSNFFKRNISKLNIKPEKIEDVLESMLLSLQAGLSEQFDEEDANQLYAIIETLLGDFLGPKLLNEVKSVISRMYPQAQKAQAIPATQQITPQIVPNIPAIARPVLQALNPGFSSHEIHPALNLGSELETRSPESLSLIVNDIKINPSFYAPRAPLTLDNTISEVVTNANFEIVHTPLDVTQIVPDFEQTREISIGTIQNPQVSNQKSQQYKVMLSALPLDILSLIFKYLHIEDQIYLSKTCKRLNTCFKQIDELIIRDNYFPLQFSEVFSEQFSLLVLRLPNLKKIILSNLDGDFFTASCYNISKDSNVNFSNLEHLEMTECDKLSEIRQFFITQIEERRTPNLRYLSMQNMVTQKEVNSLMNSFRKGKLENLVHLNLSHSKIHPSLFELFTESLALGLIPKLTQLNLSGCNLSGEIFLALVGAMRSNHCKELAFIDFSKNLIDNPEFDVFMNTVASGHLPKISHFDFSFNMIGTPVIKSIIQAIRSRNLSCVQDMKIYKIDEQEMFTDYIQVMTPLFLPKLTRLTIRAFMDNNISILPLLEAIENGQFSNITQFICEKNFFKSYEERLRFFECIKSKYFPKLAEVSISFFVDDIRSISDFTHIIEQGHIPNITHLTTSGVKLEQENRTAWARALSSGHLSNLSYFDISHSNIGDGGIIAIANALKLGHLPKLTYFNCSYVKFSIIGMEAIAHAITSGNAKDLSHLIFKGCPIDNEGLKTLLTAADLKNFLNLRTLDLSETRIDLVGLNELHQKIKGNYLPRLSVIIVFHDELNNLSLKHFYPLLKSINPNWKFSFVHNLIKYVKH